jgi:hypothetical protein
MKKIIGPNVLQAIEFKNKFLQLISNIHDLFELTREYEYPTDYEKDHVSRDMVSGRYDRPIEFTQVILDIIRVNFEPAILRYFLYTNPSPISDGMPDNPFRLGYVSLVSNCNEDFSSFYCKTVSPYIKTCGYDITQISATYAVVSTGSPHWEMKFVDEVFETLLPDFDPEPDQNEIDIQRFYAGHCYDKTLENRIRLSMWFYIPEQ